MSLVLKNGTILQLLCFHLLLFNTICETWLTAVPKVLSSISSTFLSSLLECVSVYFCHQQMAALCTSVYFFVQWMNFAYLYTPNKFESENMQQKQQIITIISRLLQGQTGCHRKKSSGG